MTETTEGNRAAHSASARRDRERSLVLVAGSGRSGTSLLAGTLQRLGFHVPHPELPADYTNPRGFAESKWVVDFHSRLLERARVQVFDARPSAWAKTAEVSLDHDVGIELRAWLEPQFRTEDGVVVKDPRLSWFLPLWRSVTAELGVTPRYVTMLRHPAAVLDSRRQWYGDWQGDATRTAAWLNNVLFTEQATRETTRIFVRYDDFVDDWTGTVERLANALELDLLGRASPAEVDRARAFVDATLRRARADWERFSVPSALREQADEAWSLLSALADDGANAGELTARLDAGRAAYTRLYSDCEAIVQSSIAAAAAWRPGTPERVSTATIRALRRVVPRALRRKIPLRWRKAVAIRLHASRG